MPDSVPTSLPEVTTGPLPASRKLQAPGQRHPGLAVAMREIALGGGEPPVRVYDTSGPYTDPACRIDIRTGLPALRGAWIEGRGDVEPYAGRGARPEDDGLKPGEAHRIALFDRGDRRPLRARGGAAVTQMAYARRGIVTPEMEYVAIRENLGRAQGARGGCRATARASAPPSPTTSRPNSCATRSPAAAPSSRPTSTTRNPSR